MSKLTQNKIDDESFKGELECEDAIIMDKQRFGRVRTSLMRHLRSKYSKKTADQALSRINKRVSDGSLKIKDQLKSFQLDKDL